MEGKTKALENHMLIKILHASFMYDRHELLLCGLQQSATKEMHAINIGHALMKVDEPVTKKENYFKYHLLHSL